MSDDWYRYFLSQPMDAQPGEVPEFQQYVAQARVRK